MSKAELDLVPHECPALPPRSPEPGLPLLPPVPRRHALWLPLFSQSTGSMVPAWHDQHMCDVICRDQGSHPSCGPSGLRPPERAGRLSSRATCPRGPPKCPDSHLPAFVYSPPQPGGPLCGPSTQQRHLLSEHALLKGICFSQEALGGSLWSQRGAGKGCACPAGGWWEFRFTEPAMMNQ